MKVVKVLGGGWLRLILIALALAVSAPPSTIDHDRSTRSAVVSDMNQLDMLDADQQMLERQPNMNSMIEQDPMWVDPEMIRLQEDYQAQIDRMMGRRPVQP